MANMSQKKLVTLVSRLDNPVYINYAGESFTLPPRGTKPNLEEAKLGAIPRGVLKQKQYQS